MLKNISVFKNIMKFNRICFYTNREDSADETEEVADVAEEGTAAEQTEEQQVLVVSTELDVCRKTKGSLVPRKQSNRKMAKN
jgi:hypothetical protein